MKARGRRTSPGHVWMPPLYSRQRAGVGLWGLGRTGEDGRHLGRCSSRVKRSR